MPSLRFDTRGEGCPAPGTHDRRRPEGDVVGNGPELTAEEIDQLAAVLRKGEALDDRYRDVLFPPAKEARLAYFGKEAPGSVLATTMAVPLQVQKRFGDDAPWRNKLIFGDNLQVLKTLLEMKAAGTLLCADGTPGVRMCYIDPPFATRREFRGTRGQPAYRDKVEGAAFIEFLRKRLILIRELLTDDGTLYVHLDSKKGHYVKVILDELFGQAQFRNEIVWWYYNKMQGNVNRFPSNHDVIYVYGKTDQTRFAPVMEERDEVATLIQRVWDSKKGKLVNAKGADGKVLYIERDDRRVDDVWRLSMLQPADRKEKVDYPTQKPRTLLDIAITASTEAGDLVLDAFVGSGTTAVAANDLGRRWVAIDCGKLAIYMTQRRLLTTSSKAGALAPFELAFAGLYDNDLLERLSAPEFREFALELFGCRASPQTIGGVEMAGTLRGDPVHIFPYDATDGSLGVGYIESLHERIRKRVDRAVFIISPASRCDPGLFEDMVTIDSTTYFILRVPYSVIEALHDRAFRPIGQPASRDQVNDALDAYGFDFIQLPTAVINVRTVGSNKRVQLAEFHAGGLDPDEFDDLPDKGRGDLAMVLVDNAYDGNAVQLTHEFFAEDLAKTAWTFDVPITGRPIMLVFVDVLGNEVRQTVALSKKRGELPKKAATRARRTTKAR